MPWHTLSEILGSPLFDQVAVLQREENRLPEVQLHFIFQDFQRFCWNPHAPGQARHLFDMRLNKVEVNLRRLLEAAPRQQNVLTVHMNFLCSQISIAHSSCNGNQGETRAPNLTYVDLLRNPNDKYIDSDLVHLDTLQLPMSYSVTEIYCLSNFSFVLNTQLHLLLCADRRPIDMQYLISAG